VRLDLGDGDSAPTFEESAGRHAWPGKGCRVFAFLITLWPRALLSLYTPSLRVVSSHINSHNAAIQVFSNRNKFLFSVLLQNFIICLIHKYILNLAYFFQRKKNCD
jgi:hypothetical protein